MPFASFESAFNLLSQEQQMAVYDFMLLLRQPNDVSSQENFRKRELGKFAGIATAKFVGDWEMTEGELCAL